MKRYDKLGTWCGFPHNLQVPRYEETNRIPTYLLTFRGTEYKKNMNISEAESFALMVFVTDLSDQSVTEGSDGIEHM